MNKDLSQGDVKLNLIWLCAPLLLSMVFQQLYSIADSVIVGKIIGSDALAAVGNSYFIIMLFLAVGSGLMIGISVVCSNLFGAKDIVRLKTAVSSAIITVIVIGGILTAIGIICSKQMLSALDTPAEIFADADSYLRVYLYGVVAVFLYNAVTGVFTALGDTRTPLLFLIVSSVANILADYLFVGVWGRGVIGAAEATVLTQALAAALSIVVLLRRLSRMTSPRFALFSFGELRDILHVALPSILQQGFVSLGNLFIQNRINSFGSDVIAGYSAAIKLNTFAVNSFVALGNGITGFTAQNVGAGQWDRVKSGFRSSIVLMLSLAVPLALLFSFFPRALIGLFEKGTNTEMLDTGASFLRIVSPFYVIICFKLIADAVTRGSKYMFTFVLSSIVDLVLRVVLAFVLSDRFGAVGIWYSWPIGWCVAVVISLAGYFSKRWRSRIPTKRDTAHDS